jgi:hypothetical protein
MESRLATAGYLATVGAGKHGFTIVGRDAGGRAQYVGGVRGIVERNAMRQLLAVQAYLDTRMGGAAERELARLGRSKATFFVPPRMASLGMWLEQLLAESTGKNGTGILPVAGEAAGAPQVYGQDRVFVRFRTGVNPKK